MGKSQIVKLHEETNKNNKSMLKIKNKLTGKIWWSNKINRRCSDEIVAYNVRWGTYCFFLNDFDVYLKNKKEWKDLKTAFKDRDLFVGIDGFRFYETDIVKVQ